MPDHAVHGISGPRYLCEGVVQLVTKNDKLKVLFDGEQKVSSATKPASFEVVL